MGYNHRPQKYNRKLQVCLSEQEMKVIELEAIERATTASGAARAILVAHARKKQQEELVA